MSRSPRWVAAVAVVMATMVLAGCRVSTGGSGTQSGDLGTGSVSHRWVLPEPYVAAGISATGDGGAWISATTPSTTALQPRGAAIGHVDQQGHLTMYRLSTPDITTGQIVADPDGTQWYTIVVGDPSSNRARNGIGWRTADGGFHQVLVSGTTERVRYLALDPGHGVWFVAYAFPRNVYGHVDANGNLVEHTITAPDVPGMSCTVPCGNDDPLGALGYLMAIAAGPPGTVWLTVMPGCQVMQVEVSSGRVLRQFTDNQVPVGGYPVDCMFADAVPDGAVAVPMLTRIAVAHPDGSMQTYPVPGFDLPLKPVGEVAAPHMQGVSVDSLGVWLLVVGDDQHFAGTNLVLVSGQGRISMFYPIPDVGQPSGLSLFPRPGAPPVSRDTVARYDTGATAISAAGDAVWLVTVVSVYEVVAH
jgi:hypothetical protein